MANSSGIFDLDSLEEFLKQYLIASNKRTIFTEILDISLN